MVILPDLKAEKNIAVEKFPTPDFSKSKNMFPFVNNEKIERNIKRPGTQAS